MTARPRVAILGGGFAGLETAFTLRQRLGDRVDLTLISDRADFLFKPNTIYIPFGKDEKSLHIPIARPAGTRARVVTPPSLVAVLARGWRPTAVPFLHPSAG